MLSIIYMLIHCLTDALRDCYNWPTTHHWAHQLTMTVDWHTIKLVSLVSLALCTRSMRWDLTGIAGMLLIRWAAFELALHLYGDYAGGLMYLPVWACAVITLAGVTLYGVKSIR